MQSRGVRLSVCLSLSICKLLHASRYFYHKHDSIATKLAHDGPHMGLHPGCAQGQGQRSRDTDTFLMWWKSLLLPQTWLDRHQTYTTWSPHGPASRVCWRSRSRSKVTWYRHFSDVTKIASSTTNMTRSPPNLHTMVPTWACIQGVLKVKVKGHVIQTLFWCDENRFFYHKHDWIATKLTQHGHHMLKVTVKVKGHVIRTLFWCDKNCFFYHKHDSIATKLAHDGPHMCLRPGCAQGQGQCQRSRDTGSSVTSQNVCYTVPSDVMSLYMYSLYEAPLHSSSSTSVRQLDVMSTSWNELLRHWRSGLQMIKCISYAKQYAKLQFFLEITVWWVYLLIYLLS